MSDLERSAKKFMLRTLTREIHESLGVVLTFAYSRAELVRVRNDFMGSWRFLELAMFELPEEKAGHSLIRLATMLRILDDQEEFLKRYDEVPDSFVCGTIIHIEEETSPLSFREFGNKIIHAERFEWEFPEDGDPMVVAVASERQKKQFKWSRAEISLKRVAGVCGQLMS